jgi:RecA-family ATPase
MIELKALTGLTRAMLVIDHARLVAMVDWNDAAQVTVLTRELHRIASEAESAVVLIAHSPKSTGAADHEISQADVAGSSALVDNARYVAIIKGMTAAEAKKLGVSEENRSNYVNFESVKSNYSPKGRVGWFKKVPCPNHHVATHEYVQLHKPIISRIGDTSEEAKVIKYVRANPDLSYTDLRARAGKKTELGLSDNQLMIATNGLLEKGLLKYVMPSLDYTKKITPNFKGVLAVANGV